MDLDLPPPEDDEAGAAPVDLSSQPLDCDALLHLVTHAMRGSLNGLGLTLHVLRRQLRSATGLTESAAERLRRFVSRLARLVTARGVLAKLEQPDWQPCLAPLDVALVLDEAMGVLAQRHRALVHLQRPEGPLPGVADRECLRQIIEQVLDNAVDRSPAQAPIEVVLSAPADGPAGIELQVRDSGAPLPLQWLRQGTATASSRGVGVGAGLLLSALLLGRLGGSMTLNTPEAGGLAVRVRLPVTRA